VDRAMDSPVVGMIADGLDTCTNGGAVKMGG